LDWQRADTTSGGKVVLTGATGSFSPGEQSYNKVALPIQKYNAAVDFSGFRNAREMYLVAGGQCSAVLLTMQRSIPFKLTW